MTLHTFPDLIQGTDEWLQARCGIVTASVVGKLITPTLKVADNDTSRGLTATLAAERVTQHIEDVFVSADMMRGTEDEPFARDAYAEHYAPVRELGFMVRDDFGFRIGYSPDGLVGDDGLIEIKSRRQKRQMHTIISDTVPTENMAQMQCGLYVSGRKWIDYVSYSAGMPLYTKRVLPDARWQAAIIAAVDTFEARVTEIIDAYTKAAEGLPMTTRQEIVI